MSAFVVNEVYVVFPTFWDIVSPFLYKISLVALSYISSVALISNVVEFKVEKEGFIVKGEDTAKFLEEKLEILGLNEREAEEFIIYWLPKLEANKYNYIRFASVEWGGTEIK